MRDALTIDAMKSLALLELAEQVGFDVTGSATDDRELERIAETLAALAPAHHAPIRKAERTPQRGSGDKPLLYDRRQAAARLGCSLKTLDAFCDSGELRYRNMGHGKQRERRMFTDDDLTAFLEARIRTKTSWASSKTRVRHIGASTSNIVGIAFSAQPKPRPGGKRKR
jgi:hypothetical protein